MPVYDTSEKDDTIGGRHHIAAEDHTGNVPTNKGRRRANTVEDDLQGPRKKALLCQVTNAEERLLPRKAIRGLSRAPRFLSKL